MMKGRFQNIKLKLVVVSRLKMVLKHIQDKLEAFLWIKGLEGFWKIPILNQFAVLDVSEHKNHHIVLSDDKIERVAVIQVTYMLK